MIHVKLECMNKFLLRLELEGGRFDPDFPISIQACDVFDLAKEKCCGFHVSAGVELGKEW